MRKLCQGRAELIVLPLPQAKVGLDRGGAREDRGKPATELPLPVKPGDEGLPRFRKPNHCAIFAASLREHSRSGLLS
jgi:hypothetical protein